jgi:lysophospholipase
MPLLTAGPTFEWVYRTMQSIDLVNTPASLKKISVPVMVINADEERVVDNSRDASICKEIPRCTFRIYKKARHNILIEKDEIRAQLFDDLKRFITSLNLK